MNNPPIPVGERLPEENQDVLAWAFIPNSPSIGGFTPRWIVAFVRKGTSYGQAVDQWHTKNWYDFRVTHWTPLPDPINP